MVIGLKGKSVCVLGLGVSGSSAARYLLSEGCTVWGADDRREILDRRTEDPDFGLSGLKRCMTDVLPEVDMLLVSPGVPRKHPFYIAASERGIPIIGEAELALGILSKKYPCIGVTGTNGKTTVTFLIEHLLEACGVKAKALGNSGIPLTSALGAIEKLSPGTVIVAELSSFQLETLHSPVLDAAVILNIKDDHLDRYSSFIEYARTKIAIFDCVKPGGKCYLEERCYAEFKEYLNDRHPDLYGRSSGSDLHVIEKMLIKGDAKYSLPDIALTQSGHDLENVLAAFALASGFAPPEKIPAALSSFKKPPHRLEIVRKVNGITFIDDSKATNVDAVFRAVESVSSPIILIAGGVDKGGSYKCWLKAFENKVRAVCTIGQAADKIRHDLEGQVPIYHFKSLDEAVVFAWRIVLPEETVLLSPGCSSYDMFTSYVHRGDVFKKIVHSLDVKDKL